MAILYETADNTNDGIQYFATQLRYSKSSKKLDWKTGNGQNTFLVETPYDITAIDNIDVVIKNIQEITITNDFIKVPNMTDIWVRFIPSKQKLKMHGSDLHNFGKRYTVFNYVNNGKDIVIHKPYKHTLSDISVQVPLEIEIIINEVVQIKKRYIRTDEEIPTGYYCVRFPKNELEGNYSDGDLEYLIENADRKIIVPITKKMIGKGKAYFFTEKEPKIFVRQNNKGLIITIKRGKENC